MNTRTTRAHIHTNRSHCRNQNGMMFFTLHHHQFNFFPLPHNRFSGGVPARAVRGRRPCQRFGDARGRGYVHSGPERHHRTATRKSQQDEHGGPWLGVVSFVQHSNQYVLMLCNCHHHPGSMCRPPTELLHQRKHMH